MTTYLRRVKPERKSCLAALLVALLLACAAHATTGFADVAPPRQPPDSNISPAEGTTTWLCGAHNSRRDSAGIVVLCS